MENKKIIAVIPARMGSSRFPGKPMEKIHGLPMVAHVYERTKQCKLLMDTYIATCDQVIYDYFDRAGGKVVMTADTHERCTDRVAEAMTIIEREQGITVDYVVLVQGDEPMVTPLMIEKAIKAVVEDPTIQVVNLMAKIQTEEEFEDPNEVKVVVDRSNYALYFSREPVPSRKKASGPVSMLKQVCIIPFPRDFLLRFNELPQTPLEIAESVDMLRILEHGDRVKMVMTDEPIFSVDTPNDLKHVEKLMENDPLMKTYL